MDSEEEKFSLCLMECTICNEIIHPSCLKVSPRSSWSLVLRQRRGLYLRLYLRLSHSVQVSDTVHRSHRPHWLVRVVHFSLT